MIKKRLSKKAPLFLAVSLLSGIAPAVITYFLSAELTSSKGTALAIGCAVFLIAVAITFVNIVILYVGSSVDCP